MLKMSHTPTDASETPHDQTHPVFDMVAQHGIPVQEGSNTATTALIPALVLTMADTAGFHDPAAMAAGPGGATETALLFDLSASPPKPAAEDASMNAPNTRRRFDNSRTPTDRGTSRSAFRETHQRQRRSVSPTRSARLAMGG